MDSINWTGRIKNPKPGEAKVGDFYENPLSWQRRIIKYIEGNTAEYMTYYRKLVKYNPINPEESIYTEWENSRTYGAATLAHLRTWGRIGNK